LPSGEALRPGPGFQVTHFPRWPGAGPEWEPAIGGHVSQMVNDGGFSDNSGSWTVQIAKGGSLPP
jgi:hypothetical protein